MTRLLIALVLAAVVGGIALVVGRRRRTAAPTQPGNWRAPAQLDRRDFDRPEAPWLVAVFSSATCNSCASMVAKARVLETAQVSVQDVEFSAHQDLHERYAIEAVPLTVIADAAVPVAAVTRPFASSSRSIRTPVRRRAPAARARGRYVRVML